MRTMWQQLKRFVQGLVRRPRFTPGTVEDSEEMELEVERKRGVRGL